MNTSCRFLVILSLGVLFDLLGLPSIAHAADVPSLDEILQIEKRMIEARKAIPSGRVVVTNRLTKFRDPSQVNVPKRREIYFDGDNIRCDKEGAKLRSQTVLTRDTTIRGFSDEGAVSVFGPKTRSGSRRGVPDPRRLGIVVWVFDTISGHGYEDLFLNPNRDQFKVEAGTDAGKPIWKVSFRIALGKKAMFTEYWLSKNQGGLPVYIGIRAGEGESQSLKSIRVKLKEYGSDGVWFPSQVIFRRVRAEQVVTEELVTVEDAVFEDIAAETFTLAGLGLPKGKTINIDGKLATWDGQRVVDHRDGDSWGKGPPRAWWRLLFSAFSVLLAVVAALLWRLRGKRSQTS